MQILAIAMSDVQCCLWLWQLMPVYKNRHILTFHPCCLLLENSFTVKDTQQLVSHFRSVFHSVKTMRTVHRSPNTLLHWLSICSWSSNKIRGINMKFIKLQYLHIPEEMLEHEVVLFHPLFHIPISLCIVLLGQLNNKSFHKAQRLFHDLARHVSINCIAACLCPNRHWQTSTMLLILRNLINHTCTYSDVL